MRINVPVKAGLDRPTLWEQSNEMRNLLLILLLSVVATVTQAKTTDHCALDQVCAVNAHDIHPTQFVVGLKEIEAREPKYRDMKPKKLEREIEENAAPAIRGPNGLLYIVDHHHLAYILIAIGRPMMYVHLIGDWTGRSEAEFENYMAGTLNDIAKNHSYLYDQNNVLRPFSSLPGQIDQLADDPYRSLAYFIKKKDCIGDPKQNYAEFAWAQFFRKSINKEEIDNDFNKAVDDACVAAKSPAAKQAHLPGVK
jgi:hypothetical protein